MHMLMNYDNVFSTYHANVINENQWEKFKFDQSIFVSNNGEFDNIT